MKTINRLAIALGLSLASITSFAQAPAGAPAGSTGQCKDGTYTTHDTKKGACSGHKGVKAWFDDKEATPAKSTATTAAATTTPAAIPAAAAAASKPAAAPAKTTTAATKAPAAGGGPGQVWVNSETKVYHCAGTRWYGKTKQGEYMTEAAAKAAGNHADHGKACAG